MYDCPENPPSEGSQTCADLIPCTCQKVVKKRQQPPNIQHELNIAKAILQESSTFSGDNLFDHLSEIIKRVLDERPPNVVDYFEELSRNIREQKFHLVDNYIEGLYDEPRCLRQALAIMNALNLLPYPTEDFEYECEEMTTEAYVSPNIDKPLGMAENVTFLQFYWKLCGFGFHTEEVFLLSCAMQKLLRHPAVVNCRFWGKIFGREKPYYIVEVNLTASEIEKRVAKMKSEMQEKLATMLEDQKPNFIYNPDLIPGCRWQNWPADELKKMKIKQPPIPVPEIKPKFDIAPEPPGSGTNRISFFVCNALTEEWIELPIVTPKQICVARLIRKYFTGNLEAEVISYPTFPGREKHLLRATIARITCATYLAPSGYYKIQKKKKDLGEGEEEEEEEEEEGEEEGGGAKQRNNDAVLIPNSNYKPLSIPELFQLENWEHVRPFILNQGRIVWFDEEKALKAFLEGEGGEEEEEGEEEGEEENDEENERKKSQPEVGPSLLTPCSEDISSEVTPMWTARISSHHNTSNRVVIIRSNNWPGAYTITIEKVVDSLYVGYGNKYLARNYSPPHIPPIQEEYPLGPEIMEILDPSVKQEEEWRLAHQKLELEKLLDQEEEEEEEDEDKDKEKDTEDESD